MLIIVHEINAFGDAIPILIKVRALEREVSDLQSEFQLDRSDYLDTIRRLEKSLKFYQQFMEKTVPVLRKEGRYWDPDAIRNNSVWLDDLNKWKLPEDAMTRLKLPPAGMYLNLMNSIRHTCHIIVWYCRTLSLVWMYYL